MLTLSVSTIRILACLIVAMTTNHSNATPFQDPVDTLVVCPADFQPALKVWINYRTAQGHRIKVITPEPDACALRDKIRAEAATIRKSNGGQLKFLFLIGDVNEKRNIAALPTPTVESPAPQLRGAAEPVLATRLPANPTPLVGRIKAANAAELAIPMHYVPAKVNQLYGSEPEISTDHPYADLTGDGLPDVAVGRLPASSAAEVRDYLERVIAYESNVQPDQTWRQRINFVAGVGGFNPTVDHVLEQVTRDVITGMIPPDYKTSMTLASWRSPFCPDPRRFTETVLERFNEGSLFWVYIGHGHPTELDKLRLPDRRLPILNWQSVDQIDCPDGSPIAVFLACYAGAIDHYQDCLTKVMLRQPGGPIAVISGTRVTMPYGMGLLMLEVADDYFNGQEETLGSLLQSAKRKMVSHQHAEPPVDSTDDDPAVTITQVQRLRTMVLSTGRALSLNPALLSDECQEHANLMHLYGDPLLRLERPQRIEVETAPMATAGTELLVQGVSPLAGQLCVELAYPRDRFRQRPTIRKKFEATDQAFQLYQQSYKAAHDLTCDVCVELVEAGSFRVKLSIPADASGECIVRCFLATPEGFALGATSLQIVK